MSLTIYFSELTTYLLIQTDRSTPKDREKSVTFRVYPRMAQREKIRLDMAASSDRSPPFQACDWFREGGTAGASYALWPGICLKYFFSYPQKNLFRKYDAFFSLPKKCAENYGYPKTILEKRF